MRATVAYRLSDLKLDSQTKPQNLPEFLLNWHVLSEWIYEPDLDCRLTQCAVRSLQRLENKFRRSQQSPAAVSSFEVNNDLKLRDEISRHAIAAALPARLRETYFNLVELENNEAYALILGEFENAGDYRVGQQELFDTIIAELTANFEVLQLTSKHFQKYDH